MCEVIWSPEDYSLWNNSDGRLAYKVGETDYDRILMFCVHYHTFTDSGGYLTKNSSIEVDVIPNTSLLGVKKAHSLQVDLTSFGDTYCAIQHRLSKLNQTYEQHVVNDDGEHDLLSGTCTFFDASLIHPFSAFIHAHKEGMLTGTVTLSVEQEAGRSVIAEMQLDGIMNKNVMISRSAIRVQPGDRFTVACTYVLDKHRAMLRFVIFTDFI
jgi:hypothetical protein